MIARRETRRPKGLQPLHHYGRRRGATGRAAPGRQGRRRGHVDPEVAGGPADDGAPAMDRATAIEHVRAAARGYCLLAALSDAGAQVDGEIRRQWMKSAARLIRFAFLLETDGIEYSGALAAVLAQLLQETREG